MADIANITIRVNAVADQAEAALESLAGTVKDVAKQGEKRLRVNVDASGMQQARVAAQGLSADMKAAGQAINAVTGKPVDMSGMLEAYRAQSTATMQAWEADLAKRQQQQAEAAAQSAQGVAEAAAQGMEQAGQAVEQSAQQTQAALSGVGASGQQVGEQVAQGGQKGADGLKEIPPAAKAASIALSGLQKLGLSVVSGIVGGLVGGLTNRLVGMVLEPIEAWIDGLIHLQEEQEKARREAVESSKDASRAHLAAAESIREMAARYTELQVKARTSAEQDEFLQLQMDLAIAMGTTTQAIDAQAKSLGGWAEAVESAGAQELTKALQTAQDASKGQYVTAMQAVDTFFSNRSIWDGSFVFDQKKFEEMRAEASESFGYMLDTLAVDMQAKGLDFSLDQQAFFQNLFNANFFPDAESVESTGREGVILGIQNVYWAIEALMSDGNMDGLLSEQAGLIDKIMYGELTPDEAASKSQEIGEQILTMWQPLFDLLGVGAEEANAFINALLPIDLIDAGTDGLASLSAELAASAANSAEMAFAASTLGAAVVACEKDFADLEKRTNSVTKLRKYVDTWDDAYKAFKNAKKGSKEAQDALDNMGGAAKDAGVAFERTEDGIEAANKQFKKMGSAADTEAAAIQSALSTLQTELVNTQAQMYLDGAAGLDTSAAESRIAALEQKIADLVAFANSNGISLSSVNSAPKKSGGGGGGKKDDAEEAARAAEEARKEAIRRDYDMIDHKRHMNEITLEEELELLEAIRRNHQLNAEEIMDWEEKVYDLKKELRERDAESIDQLGDAVVDALEARYEAMRDAELERLDASREAWEKWRDDSVKAIEDQIDALDKLSETEDREKKDAEELRKIAKLRQQIEFEQDDYNRAKLQQQLEQALSSREDRLHKLALEDQKDALREQIEQIEQKADDEISAIDKEQDEIEKAYDERLKEAALRAEAEKLMMTQSQQQILDLLKEYAPDYDATGQTLGEKLLEGFQKKVGGIADWFKSFNAQMAKAQEQMAAMAQEAAGTFYRQQSERNQTQSAVPPTVVNQTVQFNEPVESPSQVARRIEQVNEELSVLLS